jgi:probable phosphoglycerate mutase
MNPQASAVTRVLLVRHGHVEGIDPPRFRGRTDLPLTFRGIQQAERTRDLLRALPRPDAAYASPLARCMTTAEIVLQSRSIAVTPMPSFVDMDYGDWQGHSFEAVRQADPAAFSRWFETPHLAVIPGGETLLGLAARVADTMRAVVARHAGQTVLLVGHDTVNRALLLLALDLPLSRFWHPVASMNEASHLRPLG